MKKAKYFLSLILSVCIISSLQAQTNYVLHQLKQGESLSMLAKQYNTSVGDIMRMNGMHADTKLVYGSQIKIPSNRTTVQKTVVQPQQKMPGNTTNGLTHVVEKGETLFSISKAYNVSMNDIKTWNNLADNNVKVGDALIVGKNNNELQTVSTPQPKPRTEIQTQPQIENKTANDTGTKITDNASDQNNTNSTNNNINVQAQQASKTITNVSSADLKEGYFASQFVDKKTRHFDNNIAGISKTFKTESGWNDGKYYILVDNITPGAIVKLTADNGKSVFAKVLWDMGNLKENTGINFRISDATAAALHISDAQFNLTVSY